MQGILTENNEKRIGKTFNVIKSQTCGQVFELIAWNKVWKMIL